MELWLTIKITAQEQDASIPQILNPSVINLVAIALYSIGGNAFLLSMPCLIEPA
jgi:hypothetical protein